ncbi:MAG: Nif3-like dinuclear metal center hexameric protein [Heliobacteriaceae bacterium]|jgi:dinuclear metal center YbgI/SA1388 family protein|nr:Nif3-like dinuclear metal center hexameric protein [Heliobacteriaceae bacterium]
MNIDEIAEIIENFAPAELAETWDCIGFAVRSDITVNRIMLALTVTGDVVRQAHEAGADMIVSHHPLFFIPFEYKDIPIYCAHTNLDRTRGGTTDELVRILGFTVTETSDFVRYVELETSVRDLGQRLKIVSNNVRLVNNKNVSEICKIAFCAGSGSEFIEEAVCNGADAFVTGDLKFHTALESEIVLFDIGHFESEIPVLKVLAGLFADKIEIVYADERSPFILT